MIEFGGLQIDKLSQEDAEWLDLQRLCREIFGGFVQKLLYLVTVVGKKQVRKRKVKKAQSLLRVTCGDIAKYI